MYISDKHRKMLADVLPPGVDPLPIPESEEEAWKLLLELMRVSRAWNDEADGEPAQKKYNP
jgi:hypothetical protein